MKNILRFRTFAAALAIPALITAAQAQTQITGSYTNTFDTAGNTAPFTGGSVASWIYWYGLGYSNTKMTNDPTMDAGGQTNTSGSLQVYLPFGSSGDQGVFFGTLNNGGGYDGSETIDARTVTNLAFDIRFAPNTPLNAAGNLGSITMSLFPNTWENGGDFSLFPGITIPASARTNWFHGVESVTNFIANEPTAGLTNCAGLGFDYNSYSGYPTNPVTFWLDNVAVLASTAPPPPPPPPTLSVPKPAQPGQVGLDFFTTSASSQYNRYSIVTASDFGYTFIGQPSVTYSWTVTSFPGQAYSGYQQHLFLIPAGSSSTVNTENAADYNEPNVIFITLQYNSSVTATTVTNGSTVSTNSVTNWYGELEFRYKTNEPNANGMIFNGASPTNTATNPNAWPVEPVGDVRAPTATGTWSVTFNAATNVVLTAPNGSNTTFTLPAASAQLFADPLYVFLGVQANNVSSEGQSAAIGGFSITGSQAPFSESFTNESVLSANWTLDSADTNAVQFVAPGTLFVNWTTPSTGFDLRAAGALTPTNTAWTYLTGPNATNPAPLFRNIAQQLSLVSNTNLPVSNQNYYQLIKDQ